jgi:hypothetical protein
MAEPTQPSVNAKKIQSIVTIPVLLPAKESTVCKPLGAPVFALIRMRRAAAHKSFLVRLLRK